MGDSDHHPPWLQLRGRDAKVAIVVDIFFTRFFCHHDDDDHGHPLLRYRDMMALGSEGWLHNYLPPAANGASEVVLIIMIILMLVTMGRWKSDDCQAEPNNPLLLKCKCFFLRASSRWKEEQATLGRDLSLQHLCRLPHTWQCHRLTPCHALMLILVVFICWPNQNMKICSR